MRRCAARVRPAPAIAASFQSMLLAAALWLAALLGAAPGLAQDIALPDPLTPQAIDALVSRLSDAEVRGLLLDELAAKATAPAAPTEATPAAMADIARNTAALIATRVTDLPQMVAATAGRIGGYFGTLGATGALRLLAVLALAIAAGFLAGHLYRAAVTRHGGHGANAPLPRFPASVPFLARRLARETGSAVLSFAATALVMVLGLPEREAQIGMTVAVFVVLLPRIAVTVLRFFLSPHEPSLRLVQADDATAGYLYRNLRGILVLMGLGITLVQLGGPAGLAKASAPTGFWLNALVFGWMILVSWRARHGLQNIIRGGLASEGRFERALIAAYPAISITAIALTWLASAAVAAQGEVAVLRGGRHVLSLALILLAPMCDTLIRAVVDLRLPPMRGHGPAAESAHAATRGSYVRMARVIVFGVIVVTIAALWNVTLFSVAAAGVGDAYSGRVVESLLILLVGYLVWESARLAVNRRLADERVEEGTADEAHEEGHGAAASSRLATVLPAASGALQAVIFVLFGLTALGHLGVDVTALLAGAGVVGIAIGFGAQKLVADVVSGVFFLIDDAFRLNEYIDAGGVQGTVERIALRSLMLRQSDGAINCIPYSNISAITNFSRDWGIMKLTFTVAFGTDTEQVRKIFKRIGQDLLANPEYKDAFIEPFKSQGVREITDIGMVVRGRFTFRPECSKQYGIRREVFKRVQADFAKAGIDFARREVRVSLGAGGPAVSGNDALAIGAAAAQGANSSLPDPVR